MKIVSLLPSATEILCELGLEASLVAVSHECDVPATVKALPKATSSCIPEGMDPADIDDAVQDAVASGAPLYQVDASLLHDLAPDLIVTQGLCDVCAVTHDTIQAACDLRPTLHEIPVLSLTGTSFEGVLSDILAVGDAAEIPTRAARLVDALKARWHALKAPETGRPEVFMLEWPDPPWVGGHWVPEQVEAAGGTHLIGTAGAKSTRVSWDDIEAADPDILCVMACGFDLPHNVGFAQALHRHPRAGALRAVRQGQLFALDANRYFSRPAPGLVEGAELLHAIFHEGREVPGKSARVPAP